MAAAGKDRVESKGTVDSSKEAAYAKDIIMCSYKLCRVEFRYWGLQGKIERFIHDVGQYRYISLIFLNLLYYRNINYIVINTFS